MKDVFRKAWFVTSKPVAFANALEEQPQERRAIGSGVAASLLAAAHLALYWALATGSTWWLVVLLVAPLGAALAWLVQAGLGALVLLRPGGLGALAYPLLAWSFVPSAVVTVSLWPAALLDAQAAFVASVVMLPLVHVRWLALALSGVQVAKPVMTLALYVLVTLVGPLALIVWILEAFASV